MVALEKHIFSTFAFVVFLMHLNTSAVAYEIEVPHGEFHTDPLDILFVVCTDDKTVRETIVSAAKKWDFEGLNLRFSEEKCDRNNTFGIADSMSQIDFGPLPKIGDDVVAGRTVKFPQESSDADDKLNLTECDIRLNTDVSWHIPIEPPLLVNAHDLYGVVVHEFGHCIGLGHSADESAVMFFEANFPSSVSDLLKKRELSSDDVKGRHFLYGKQ